MVKKLVFALCTLLIAVVANGEIPVSIVSNGLATFRIVGSNDVREFINNAKKEQLLVLQFSDSSGNEYRRVVDKESTLKGVGPYLEVYTMSPLNSGVILPSVGAYIDAILKVSSSFEYEDLFTYESLYNEQNEMLRKQVVVQVSNDYLINSKNRDLMRQAAEIPLLYFSGAELARDEKGRLPLTQEVKSVTSGYPQAYSFRSDLKAHARALSRLKSKKLEGEVNTEGSNGLPLTIVGKKQIGQKTLRFSKMSAHSIDIIPYRMFPTGNIYEEPELEPFSYFRLPGHSVKAFDVQSVGEKVFPKGRYIIELVAYNGYSFTVSSESGAFFLLLPDSMNEPSYYLGCPQAVDEN
ncbi:MAG: hypothetical protein AAF065_08145, partial [Verrucomicrobiota bacterium]